MASRIDIREYASGLTIGGFPVGKEPGIADQIVLITAGSLSSAKFSTTTTLVRIHADAICSILFSTAGTAATANNARMSANQTEYFGVNPGDVVTVISST